MSAMSDPESLQVAISQWRAFVGDLQALEKIARSGPKATEMLAEEMHRRSLWYERVHLAAALGYGSGEAGVDELRWAAQETGPHTMDLRCAALLALAKRVGSDATDDFALALSDKTGAVREYSIMCLAAVGNGSARQAAFAQLRSWLKKPAKRPRGEMDAIVYLLRTDALDRIVELRDLLNENQSRMDPEVKDRLAQLWPEALSGQPIMQDDVGRIRAGVWSSFLRNRRPLFEGILPGTAPTYS